MRIISKKRLADFWSAKGRQDTEKALRQWLKIVSAAAWNTTADVKQTFGRRVDFVQARRTKNTVEVFDIAANKYRLIAHVHFLAQHPEKGRVYVLRIMSHAEYDKAEWKDEL